MASHSSSSTDSIGEGRRSDAPPPASAPPSSPQNLSKVPPRLDARQVSASLASSAGDGVGAVVTSTSTFPNGTQNQADLFRYALKAVLYAMFFNGLIAACKLGIAMGITRSAALFSEGLHSLADAFNSMTLLFGLIQGKRTPDRNHPFGYGLETNLWALLASLMLLLSATVSVIFGVQHLLHPEPIGPAFWGLVILGLSVVFEMFAVYKASQAVLQEVGQTSAGWFNVVPAALLHIRQVQSPTTRFVFYEDLVALLGALLALLALSLTEVAVHLRWLSKSMAHIPDAITSILIGFLLLGLAIRLFSDNRSVLTGAAAPVLVEQRIRDLVMQTHGIWAILDVRTMDQGAGGLFIHLKVEVNPDIPIRDMDDIILHLKERLQSNLPNVREVLVEAMADESELAWNQKFSKLIEEGQRDEVLNPREVEILKNFFDFTQTDLADVMVPRPDVLSVELTTPIIEVADLFIESRYSKLPVYKERVDNVVGVVHERDVFECLRHQHLDTPLSELLRDIDRYPETKAVSDLLEDFKRKRIQMAAVADEHGAFAGMVTLADIMEQLVGDLWDDDRHEEEAPSLEQLSPTLLRLNGKYDIWDLNELYGLNIPDDDYKTIGGFVFGLLGREPEAGDEVVFEGMTFKVEEADEARIVSVCLSSPTELSLVEPSTPQPEENPTVKPQESL